MKDGGCVAQKCHLHGQTTKRKEVGSVCLEFFDAVEKNEDDMNE